MQIQRVESTTIAIFLLIFYYYYSVSHVSSADTLNKGDMLNFSAHLVSADGVFTLGFYKTDANINRYLGVWFTHHYDDYPIWLGNRDKPATDNSSVLTISNTGKLIINSSGGDPIELYANENGLNITATLLNSGNFVVKETNINGSGDRILWQSFDYPTNTLLPGMKLGLNQRTQRNWSLASWFSYNKPEAGAYTLEWDPSRHRLIVRRRGVAYWTSGELKDYTYEKRPDLKLKKFENIDGSYDPYNFTYNFVNVSNDDEDYMSYSLEIDPVRTPGNLKVSGWKLYHEGVIKDVCSGRVIMNATSCDGYKTGDGCELREQPKCRNQEEKFVLRSGHFNPSALYFDNNSSLAESDCRDYCWNNCECVGYVARSDFNESGCEYWIGKSSFVQSLAGNEDKNISVLNLTSDPANKGGSSIPRASKATHAGSIRKKKMIWTITAVVITAVLLFLGSSWFIMRKIKQGKLEEELEKMVTLDEYKDEGELDNDGRRGHDLRMFTHSSIMAATNSFSPENKLGEGAFGPVYKGKMVRGREIAVKVLSRGSNQGLQEFKTELILISKIQHVNLVKLFGFCIHGDEKMIIYDYMPNKSLDFFLFRPAKELLNWETRFSIIEGIAQGLLYLHKYSRLRIVHRDLKASNILLDENMNPKISDFGLAKIVDRNVIEANTDRCVGTYGYMAPEISMQGTYSTKSDVYSFGVLMLEIVSGQKNNSFHNQEGPLNLVEYAWELWNKDAAIEIMDPTLKSSCIHIDQLQRCIHVGLLCLENRATDRPTIEDVLSMLKNEMMHLPMPKCPAFVTRGVVHEFENGKSEKFSANGMSLSSINGR